MFQKMLVVDGITERCRCTVHTAKTHDGLRNAINLQVFVTNKHA